MKFITLKLLLVLLLLVVIISNEKNVVRGGRDNNNNKFIELFKPVQLIYPDSNHNQLIINETSINLLNSLLVDEKLSVLGVVGTFHSGKSFLLNQLLGTYDSFTVGPTVHPQTIGIWMWACKLYNEDGKTYHNLLLLDTEGFYSSNVSETYDAKVFAITTLLSSHLIYNSVKIIDQSALEYLELLSRRTQLFALKTQIKTKENSSGGVAIEEGEDKKEIGGLDVILNFPSLTWVVQDFFQDIGDETPTQWLNNLLKAHTREKVDSEVTNSLISITDIFPSIECHTLFLPSGDRDTLRHLDRAKLIDLNPVYIKELNQLKYSLFSNKKQLKPKLSGPSISTLLKLLVNVANSNKFPTVPSIWSGFIKEQQQSALEDSILAYDEKMRQIINNGSDREDDDEEPLSNEELIKLEKDCNSYSSDLYKQLLFGLEEAYRPGQYKLQETLKEHFKNYLVENNNRIRKYCQRIFGQLIDKLYNELDSIKIPTPSEKLLKQLKLLEMKLFENYTQKTKIYKVNGSTNSDDSDNNNNNYAIYLNLLERDIERLTNNRILQNKNEIEILLTKASQVISEKYKLAMGKLIESGPITIERLNKENNILVDQLMNEKYKQITEIAKHESYYQAFEAMSEKKLLQLYNYFNELNENKIQEKCKLESDYSIVSFKKSISTILLPIEEEQLIKYINEFKLKSINSYKSRLSEFKDSSSYSKQFNKLEAFLEKQAELKIEENVTQMKMIVMESLDVVRTMMISRTSLFWFQHSFEAEAYREAEKRIVDKITSKPLRDKVIKQFINSDLKNQRDSLFKLSTLLITCLVILLFSVLISISLVKK